MLDKISITFTTILQALEENMATCKAKLVEVNEIKKARNV